MNLEYRTNVGEFILAIADYDNYNKFHLAIDFFHLPAFSFCISWNNIATFWIAIGEWIYIFDLDLLGYGKKRIKEM